MNPLRTFDALRPRFGSVREYFDAEEREVVRLRLFGEQIGAEPFDERLDRQVTVFSHGPEQRLGPASRVVALRQPVGKNKQLVAGVQLPSLGRVLGLEDTQ